MAREGVNDPQGFAKGQIKDAIIGALVVPILMVLGFWVLLFILSFTGMLGGPYGLAKFFFWFVTIIYGIVGFVLLQIFSTLKRVASTTQKKYRDYDRGNPDQTNGVKYRDVEVVREE